MTQAEKRAKASPILKGRILAGDSMADAAAAAEVSVNTAFRYRRMDEEVGGPWATLLTKSITEGKVPDLQELIDLEARLIKHFGGKPIPAEATLDDATKLSDAMSKFNRTYLDLCKRLDDIWAQANNPEFHLKVLGGYRQWLFAEQDEGRLTEADVARERDLVDRYSSDLSEGRFEVQPK